MEENSNASRMIRLARLKLSAPEVVYEALEAYGARNSSLHFSWDTDEKMELALEARNDPLINLALAKNAASQQLLWRLYSRARSGSMDPEYDKAIRLACLSNTVAAALLFTWRTSGLSPDEERRLATEGENDEVRVWLQNPNASEVLRDLYRKNGPFDGVDEQRWMFLVQASSENPRLQTDYSNDDGPDLLMWEIQDGIVNLLLKAPTTPLWLETLYFLLIGLKKESIKAPSAVQVNEILGRWSATKVGRFTQSESNEERDGLYTEQSFAQEFRCLVAALYGAAAAGSSTESVGGAEDADVARRCAFYGNGSMTAAQIEKAYEKDGKTLCFSALLNDRVLIDEKSRAALESRLPRDLMTLYDSRCKDLAKGRGWFDPRPVSEALEERLANKRESQSVQQEDLWRLGKELQVVRKETHNLLSKIFNSLILVMWGLAGVGVLVFFSR